MQDRTEECIWIRAAVLLAPGYERPTVIQTRRLSNSGVFLECTGPIAGQSVEIVFPTPYCNGDGYHLFGTVTHRWSDGVWISFSENPLAATEMLMRIGPPIVEGLSEGLSTTELRGCRTQTPLPCLPKPPEYALLTRQ